MSLSKPSKADKTPSLPPTLGEFLNDAERPDFPVGKIAEHYGVNPFDDTLYSNKGNPHEPLPFQDFAKHAYDGDIRNWTVPQLMDAQNWEEYLDKWKRTSKAREGNQFITKDILENFSLNRSLTADDVPYRYINSTDSSDNLKYVKLYYKGVLHSFCTIIGDELRKETEYEGCVDEWGIDFVWNKFFALPAIKYDILTNDGDKFKELISEKFKDAFKYVGNNGYDKWVSKERKDNISKSEYIQNKFYHTYVQECIPRGMKDMSSFLPCDETNLTFRKAALESDGFMSDQDDGSMTSDKLEIYKGRRYLLCMYKMFYKISDKQLVKDYNFKNLYTPFEMGKLDLYDAKWSADSLFTQFIINMYGSVDEFLIMNQADIRNNQKEFLNKVLDIFVRIANTIITFSYYNTKISIDHELLYVTIYKIQYGKDYHPFYTFHQLRSEYKRGGNDLLNQGLDILIDFYKDVRSIVMYLQPLLETKVISVINMFKYSGFLRDLINIKNVSNFTTFVIRYKNKIKEPKTNGGGRKSVTGRHRRHRRHQTRKYRLRR